MIVSAPAAEGVVESWATPSVSVTVPRVVDPFLEGHGPGRHAGARADDADGGVERHRLAEDRRGGRRRHDDLGGRRCPP